MKREDKYPETRCFIYFNQNPKNRKTADCSFRAISLGLNKPYNDCVIEMAQQMCRTGYALDDSKGIEKYLESQGYTKKKQPRKYDNTKYTGAEFCELLNDDYKNKSVKIIANIGGNHIVCIKKSNGLFKIHDTWNSSFKCIGNYWVIEEA